MRPPPRSTLSPYTALFRSITSRRNTLSKGWRATLYAFRTFLASEVQWVDGSNRAKGLPLSDFCTLPELQSGVGDHPGHLSNTLSVQNARSRSRANQVNGSCMDRRIT